MIKRVYLDSLIDTIAGFSGRDCKFVRKRKACALPTRALYVRLGSNFDVGSWEILRFWKFGGLCLDNDSVYIGNLLC